MDTSSSRGTRGTTSRSSVVGDSGGRSSCRSSAASTDTTGALVESSDRSTRGSVGSSTGTRDSITSAGGTNFSAESECYCIAERSCAHQSEEKHHAGSPFRTPCIGSRTGECTRTSQDESTSGSRDHRAAHEVPVGTDPKAAPEIRLYQHGEDVKGGVAGAQQPHHPYSLLLPSVGTAANSLLTLLERRSSRDSGKPHAPQGDSTHSLHSAPAPRGSCCASAQYPAAASLSQHKEASVPPVGTVATVDPNTTATVPGDAESDKGRSVGGPAMLAAETFVNKIRSHGRQRSASHQPLTVQKSSESDKKYHFEEQEKTPPKGTVSAHRIWREFFWHAWHSASNVPIDASTQQQTAATIHNRGGELTTAGHDNGCTAAGTAGAAAALANEKRDSGVDCDVLHPLGVGTVAGKTAGEHLVVPVTHHREGHLCADDAFAHNTATLLHSAVHAVKSLPQRLRKELKELLRARKNSVHMNHAQRLQRVAEVLQQRGSSAAFALAGDNGTVSSACSAAAVSAAESRDEQGVTAAPAGSRHKGTSHSERYTAHGMPAGGAGRHYPRNSRKRAQDLQAMLRMRQVLPCQETRGRLLQHVQSNINKGRRDFEQASPLLSLRKEQLLPCGSMFVVRCLQEDNTASVTQIRRKWLVAGRLIGGGSEAMVFAAVESAAPQPPALCWPLSELVEWGRAAAEDASRSISRQHALFHSGADRAAASVHAAEADLGGRTPTRPTVSANEPGLEGHDAAGVAGGGVQPVGVCGRGLPPSSPASHGVRGALGSASGVSRDSSGLNSREVQHSRKGEKVIPSCTAPEPPAAARVTAEGAGAYEGPPVARGGGSQMNYRDDASRRGTLGSSHNSVYAQQEWGRCWALKWFLCEPFLMYSRRKAEQEGTIVDWLQMALWRLVPSNGIDVEVVNRLGIVAPHWIGFIEGLSVVSPGDEHFALLNRVAAMPLMLGDMLTVPPASLTTSDRLYCVMRLIQAVANLHIMGVLHNDIKLENMLIGTDGTLHIGDLGTITPFTGRPTRFQRIGTDVYLDPQSAQSFLDYGCTTGSQQDQMQVPAQKKSWSRVMRGTRVEREEGARRASTLEGKPGAGPGASISRRTTARGRASRDGERLPAVAAEEGNMCVKMTERTEVGASGKRSRDCDGGCPDRGEIEGGEGEARDEGYVQSRQKTSERPFRVVYTPLRDAWAVGIVCYYIWCGGYLPYNLRRAFEGDITGVELLHFLAGLPRAQKGNPLHFPLAGCPDGEAPELVEVRRIIQGLLEPDSALRKTPAEIVQESPLFSAYREGSFRDEDKTQPQTCTP